MYIQKEQSGNAHIVVIIMLSIALIATLGYTVYQNLQKTSDTPKQANSEIVLSEVAYDKSMSSNLAFKYPSSWTIKQESHASTEYPDPSYDSSIVTSADGKVSAHFVVSTYTGLGADDCSNVKVDVVQTDKITGLDGSGFVAYKVTTIPSEYNGNTTAYKYFIGAQSSKNINSIAKSCEGFGGNMTRPNTSQALPESLLLNFYVEFNDYEVGQFSKGFNAPGGFDIFDNGLKTDNYQTAKRIIQSLYVK